MPRRGTVTRREVLPDPVYNSKLVTQVINKVLLDGKKSTAEQIVYGALEIIREKTGRDPVEVLQDAIQALTPHLEVRSRRVGGATYQVPVEVPGRRAQPPLHRRKAGAADAQLGVVLHPEPAPAMAGQNAVQRLSPPCPHQPTHPARR